uniref:Uncharacterized protein n=1 Tax=Picea glauca TaxID=3330 RepID=A0A117NI46_PICGL|nr:hypothetical protein ABT39_MTgene3917 [Picea glauca]
MPFPHLASLAQLRTPPFLTFRVEIPRITSNRNMWSSRSYERLGGLLYMAYTPLIP